MDYYVYKVLAMTRLGGVILPFLVGFLFCFLFFSCFHTSLLCALLIFCISCLQTSIERF